MGHISLCGFHFFLRLFLSEGNAEFCEQLPKEDFDVPVDTYNRLVKDFWFRFSSPQIMEQQENHINHLELFLSGQPKTHERLFFNYTSKYLKLFLNLTKCTSCAYQILQCFHKILTRQQLASFTGNCKGQKRSYFGLGQHEVSFMVPKTTPLMMLSWNSSSNFKCNSELPQRENSSLASDTSNQEIVLFKNNLIWIQWKPDQSFSRKRTIQWNVHRHIKASTSTVVEPL